MRTEFEFDGSKGPAENLDFFLQHLATEEAALAALLRDALNILLPLPESGLQRTAKRQQANAKVLLGLESLDV